MAFVDIKKHTTLCSLNKVCSLLNSLEVSKRIIKILQNMSEQETIRIRI